MKTAILGAYLRLAANCPAGETPIDLSSLANEAWTFVGPEFFGTTALK